MSDIEEALDKTPFDMTNVLLACEKILPQLLADPSIWKSLFIDYEPPHLMRIYTQVGKIRINLHYFLPTDQVVAHTTHALQTPQSNAYSENLFHPHGWASCMKILKGTYEKWLGFATGRGLTLCPPKTLHLVHHTGDTYAMNHPWLWHQVIPIPSQAVFTIMVTYVPPDWDQDAPKVTGPHTLRQLTTEETQFMLEQFRMFY